MRQHSPERMPSLEVAEEETIPILSDTEGRITKLVATSTFLFATDEAELDEIPMAKRYGHYYDPQDSHLKTAELAGLKLLFLKELLASLPAGVTLVMVIPTTMNARHTGRLIADFRAGLASMGIDDGRVEIKLAPNSLQLGKTEWARDYWAVGGDNRTLIVPNYGISDRKLGSVRNMDNYAAKFADGLGLEKVDCPFYFEGGDLKSDNGVLYIGLDGIISNLEKEKRHINIDEVKSMARRMGEWFGMEPYIVGLEFLEHTLKNSPRFFSQKSSDRAKEIKMPFFHIDLFFTPLGDNKFAVGDIGLALDILRDEFGENAGSVMRMSLDQIDRKVYQELGETAGTIDFAESLSKKIKPTINALEGRLSNGMRMFLEQAMDFLDDFTNGLTESGREVIRLPLLPDVISRGAIVTYNNSLVQNFYEDGSYAHQVIMPTFGVPRRTVIDSGKHVRSDAFHVLDEAAKKILNRAGFSTITVPNGFTRLAYAGSLNCGLLAIRE